MEISKSTIIANIRKAIDDIMPSGTDSFSTNTDDELWQATFHAVQALLMELSFDLLTPSSMASRFASSNRSLNADGSVNLELDDSFLRFVNIRLGSWNGNMVTDLMEPDSDEAIRQRTKWGRGTSSKPRAMLDYDSTSKRVLRCWPVKTRTESSVLTYDDTVDVFNYIPKPTQSTTAITCALRDVTEQVVIYRAASIFFEGKKESEIADKFRQLSNQ